MNRARRRQKLHPLLPILEPSKKRNVDKKPLKVISPSSRRKRFFNVSYRNKD